MTTPLRLSLLAISSIVVSACSGGGTKPDAGSKPPNLKIASAFDITGGTVDALAPSWENAAVLAVEQVNAGGGLGTSGRQLELVKIDSESKADVAVSRLQTGFNTDKYPVVITGISVVSVGVANNFAKTNSVLHFCTACTTPGLTPTNGDGWTYRASPSAELQGPILAKHVFQTLGFTRVAVAHSDEVFGNGIAKAFSDAFRALDGGVVIDVPHPQAVKSSYAADLTQITATPADGGLAPQAIFLGSFINNSVKFVQDWQTGGYTIPFVFPHTARVATLLMNVDATKLEGMGGSSNVTIDGAQGDKLAAAFKTRFSSDLTLFTATAYDSTMVAALAIEATGKETPTGAEVKAALAKVQAVGGDVIGVNEFAKAKAALAAGKSINYVGASGPMDFDSTNSAHGRFVLWKIQAGKFVDLSITDIP